MHATIYMISHMYNVHYHCMYFVCVCVWNAFHCAVQVRLCMWTLGARAVRYISAYSYKHNWAYTACSLYLSLSRKLRDDVPNKLHILSSHGVKHKYMLIRTVHKHKYVAVRASVRFDTHMTTKIFGFISSQHYWSLHFSNNIAEPNIPRLKGFGPATSRGGGRDNYAQIPSTRRECAAKKTCYICDLLRLICLLGAVHFEIEVICHVSQFVLGVLIYASIVSARPQLFSLSLKNFDE